MEPGGAGLMFLDVLIPVVEVRNIRSGSVTIPVQALVETGVPATQLSFSHVTHMDVQVKCFVQ